MGGRCSEIVSGPQWQKGEFKAHMRQTQGLRDKDLNKINRLEKEKP